jgi:hypothetical protein
MVAVTVSGQARPRWETPAEIRFGVSGTMLGTVDALNLDARIITLRLDDAAQSRVAIEIDEASTRFRRFTTGIDTDVLRGRAALDELRLGDRLEVTGIGGQRSNLAATDVTLLGRAVAGETMTVIQERVTRVEGVVRSVNAAEHRVVIETGQRQLYTIVGSAGTAVMHAGTTYRIRNLEPGDEVAVEIDRWSDGVIRPRLIEVLRDVSAGRQPAATDRTITGEAGVIARIDARAFEFLLQPDRGRQLRVDASAARDDAGRPFNFDQLRVGDSVEVQGRYDARGVFLASAIRWFDPKTDRGAAPLPSPLPRDDRWEPEPRSYRVITISGTIEETLERSGELLLRDRATGRTERVLADEELIVRSARGTYFPARQLRRGERITVRGFEDPGGIVIAQAIRVD